MAALCAALIPLCAVFNPPEQTHAATQAPVFDQPDQVCRTCHQKIYDSYERTAKARGSGPATEHLGVPLMGARGFYHEPSGITYRITLKDGQAQLSYNRPATRERAGLDGERRLDYFIGSGKRGRTYLYQAEGLWFEAPINWYGKKKVWDMAPAYENVTSMPDPLPVEANCLHCHAGEVQPNAGGTRNRFAGPPFKQAGVGCAACHGDPAAHLASAGTVKPGTGPILNPDKLDPRRRDSVCLQCHLEGDATVFLPGKRLANFKPGENLWDSALYFVDKTRAQNGGRASSQYEALLRSACKRAAGDKLTCTTCHDPHSTPAPAERVAFFRGRCLQCHTSPAMATQHHPEQQDCATCHMPTRKTLDISHEQLTDHDIEARPEKTARLASRLQAPELVPVGQATAGDRELGLAYAQLAQHGSRPAGEIALRLLLAAEQAGNQDAELHDQLGYLLQRAGQPTAAAQEYTAALRSRPQDVTAAANLAVLDAGRGQTREAIALLQQAIAEDPSQTGAGLNLAFLECRLGRKSEALATVEHMLKVNPDSPQGHEFLEKGDLGGAFCALK